VRPKVFEHFVTGLPDETALREACKSRREPGSNKKR
jgi:hypothetical protein